MLVSNYIACERKVSQVQQIGIADAESCQSQTLPENQISSESGTGTLKFEIEDDVDPCQVDGYIVGQEDNTQAVQIDETTFAVPNVPEGEQELIVTSAGRINIDNGGLGWQFMQRLVAAPIIMASILAAQPAPQRWPR